MRIFAFLCVLAGCMPVTHHTPELDEQAFSIVWEGTYGGYKEQRPQLIWHDSSNCQDQYGNSAFITAYGSCLAGLTRIEPLRVDVLWYSWGSYGDCPFAHELLHSWLYLQYGDTDANHTREEWGWLLHAATNALYNNNLSTTPEGYGI